MIDEAKIVQVVIDNLDQKLGKTQQQRDIKKKLNKNSKLMTPKTPIVNQSKIINRAKIFNKPFIIRPKLNVLTQPQ